MAYNSTSWTADGLSKATNSTSTNDSLSINGTLTVGGASTLTSTLTIGVDDTGHDVKFFGATSGSFMLWDESDDALELTDSSPIKIGDGGDMTIYHDGSNSYVTNATGALKIATETSGIAVSIGHTTSETTVNDNLTITGNVDIVSDSSTELNFSSGSGSDVANIYSDGNMLIKAAASKQIGIGTNNQTDSVIIDSSENVTLQGTLQVGGNVIKASDGGNTITMDTSDNVTIAGDLTVTGGKITFGNAEYISNESDNFITLLTNPSSSGQAIISSAGATQLQIKSVNNDAHITFFNGSSTIWNIGYDYDDSNILKFDYGNTTGNATKLNLTSGGELILSGDGVIALKETTTPTAVADYGRIYTKNDNKLYFQDGAGTEHEISFA